MNCIKVSMKRGKHFNKTISVSHAAISACLALGVSGALLPGAVHAAETAGAQKARPADAMLNQYYADKKTDPAKARHDLREIIRRYPDDARARLEMGYLLLKEKNNAAALTQFKAAARINPRDYQSRLQVAFLLDGLGRHDEAKRWFTEATHAPDPQTRAKARKALANINRVEAGANGTAGNLPTREYALAMGEYYRVKRANPRRAQKLLADILRRYPNDRAAHQEMGYLLFAEKRRAAALAEFKTVARLAPNDGQVKLQLGYLLDGMGRHAEAKRWFSEAAESDDPTVRAKGRKALANLSQGAPVAAAPTMAQAAPAPVTPPVASSAPPPAMQSSTDHHLYDAYYRDRQTNPAQAQRDLEAILAQRPNDARAHREMGYFLLDRNDNAGALAQFETAAHLDPNDGQSRLQAGYLLDSLDRRDEARQWFQAAAASNDPSIRLKGETAVSNLGVATSGKRNGRFTDIYVAPYYSSRFSEGVAPLQIRSGRAIDDKTDVYFSLRATRDTKTRGGLNPQIYDDNALIAGVGITRRFTPNVSGYAEAGVGYDLVDRNRSRVRPDLRGGVLYWKEWNRDGGRGQLAGDAYGDLSYYSRYHNLIGDARIREGVNLYRQGATRVNAYLKGEIFADTGRQYYNNRIEIGPGIGYTPNLNKGLSLRAEWLRGHYLGNLSGNPYPVNYHDVRLEVDYGIRF